LIFSRSVLSQENACINRIHMPHMDSTILYFVTFRVGNSQFYRSVKLCNFKEFFIAQITSLINVVSDSWEVKFCLCCGNIGG